MNEQSHPALKPKVGVPYKTARLISDVANPLILPFLVFAIIGWQLIPTTGGYLLIIGLAFLFYTALPFGIVQWLLNQKHISSLDAPEHETRNKLFCYSVLSSSAGSILLFFISENLFLKTTALVYLINPLVGLLITLGWKVSIHASSFAIAAYLISYYNVAIVNVSFSFGIMLISALFLFLLLLMWARRNLKVHTPSEVLGGAVIGAVLTSIELMIFL